MYRNLETGIWSDPWFRGLAADAKLLFFYFVTNPHSHMCGIYYLPEVLIPLETGLSPDRVRELLSIDLQPKVMVDPATSTVWVMNMLKYQPANDKISKGVAKHLSTLHGCALIGCFLKYYGDRCIPYRYGIDTVSIPVPEPEIPHPTGLELGIGLEQETNPSRSGERGESPKPKVRKKPSGPNAEFVASFTAEWRERFGDDYHFQAGKDGAAVGRILAACKGDLEKAKRIALAFFTDATPFIADSGHTIAVLSSQMNRYLAGANGNREPDESASRGFQRQPVPPDLMSLIEQAAK